ncbi:hypothetical protein FQN54_006435 [Arachnomyces sp. PD_36]|nr:hypothetical protein FQN54_006435 [Arachnomyces sp. PD_36]
MHLGKLGVFALAAATADAFKDTSPFFFFSSSEILSSTSQIRSASSLSDDLVSKLGSCPSDFYVLVSQPGVHAVDYSRRTSSPLLREKVLGNDENIGSSFMVNEVLGGVDGGRIQDTLVKKCGAQTTELDASTGTVVMPYDKTPSVLKVDFPTLPRDTSRAQQLAENDAFLATVLELIPSSHYTVIYTTTPRQSVESDETESFIYEMDADIGRDPIHIDLKRDMSAHSRQNEESSNLPLFEVYQFLSPGVFMGLLAAFFFFSILYVGISAIGSLEVSYAAFDKEMGPTVSKKQQ